MRTTGVLIAALMLAGCSGGGGAGTGAPEAACVLHVRYDGAVYEGVRETDREPLLTGRTGTAVVPGCNDTGEAVDPPGEEVVVEEIDGIPMSVAVWALDSVLVRGGAELPASADAWWGRPACDLRDPVTLTGRWVGVRTEAEPRFDGDLRTPLVVTLRVEPGHGNPTDLERWTLRVHDDGSAAPALDERYAEQALWSSRALLAATVTCDGLRYRATGFDLVD